MGFLHFTVFICLITTGLCISAEEPTWAKKAIAFECECRDKKDWPQCVPLRISSPDRHGSVEVLYRQPYKDDAAIGDIKVAYLKVRLPNGIVRETTLPTGFQPEDLLWAPDSKAFFVNGGMASYWGFWVYVYRISDPQLHATGITQFAQRDMVKTFPPCKAAGLEEKDCRAMEKEPGYSMSGIDWVDASTVAVLAEIPCSRNMGGIKCQAMGYEIEVPTGRIRRRMDAQEFKTQWQKSMAWNFQVPEPPKYKPEK